jgi:rhodanese-related sulfurtransferase
MGVYDELPPHEFSDMLNESATPQLIDVRSVREYEKGHLPCAKNAPYFGGNFEHIIDSLQLDTLQPIFIYCETQHRSPPAANILHDRGFDQIRDLKNGFWKWKRQGQAIEY